MICDVCKGSNTTHCQGFHRPYWKCNDCGASVSCHKKGNEPMGKFALKETKDLRREAHVAFDPIWQERHLTRNKAYHWLSCYIGNGRVHMAQLTDDELRKVVELSQRKLAELRELAEHRKPVKNDNRFHKERRIRQRNKRLTTRSKRANRFEP